MPKSSSKSWPLKTLDFVRTYWVLLTLLGGFLATYAALPRRLEATEKKVDTLTQQTAQIAAWVAAQEKTQELIRKAPPGFKWDAVNEEFVVDPNYRSKKGR